MSTPFSIALRFQSRHRVFLWIFTLLSTLKMYVTMWLWSTMFPDRCCATKQRAHIYINWGKLFQRTQFIENLKIAHARTHAPIVVHGPSKQTSPLEKKETKWITFLFFSRVWIFQMIMHSQNVTASFTFSNTRQICEMENWFASVLNRIFFFYIFIRSECSVAGSAAKETHAWQKLSFTFI